MTATASDYSLKPTSASTFQYSAAHTVVQPLLQSRLESLSRYNDVMELQPFEENDILQEVLEDFCESVVDYTARAHFKLYKYLDYNKVSYAVSAISLKIYPLLIDNTQQILDFHDEYSSDNIHFDCRKLETCLSQMGELLADRILLEDRLIDAIFSCSAEQGSAAVIN